ncbi:hypothetical protein [Nodosilinea sp. FACHB-13]|uniref:hypothetical protein n=1 Tax=Cyanophyceae TaxID=3028117 RepID=UPI0016859192|nr:hypothetical protein [Nodosilinea sp. FACHB-13]MBD2107408.1 hypothetical protein [Nodosilinea sp. FACHB-13]
MVAYNFKPQFAGPVERGEKTQTIRRTGKRRHARPGDTLQLYTGMRTKSCRLLALVKCSNTWAIEIRPDGRVYLDGELLNDVDQVQQLVQDDGFGDIPEFLWFFCPASEHFKGVLIKWEALDDA